MTSEAAILRAYALLTQGRCEEAERVLNGNPDALKTPSGADLFARLRFEQGLEDEALKIWERIHAVCPDFDPASRALAAFASPPPEPEDEEPNRLIVPIVTGLVLALGVGLALWGCFKEPSRLVQVHETVVTNMVERVVELPVTTYVTSIVEKVSVVTDTVTVVKHEVTTNTIESVVVKEVEKVVYKEREPVAIVATNDLEKVEGATAQTGGSPKEPSQANKNPREFKHVKLGKETWLDKAIMDFCIELGLVPGFGG